MLWVKRRREKVEEVVEEGKAREQEKGRKSTARASACFPKTNITANKFETKLLQSGSTETELAGSAEE